MTRPSDSLDDLTGDLRCLTTLVRQITILTVDIIDPRKQQCEQTQKELAVVTDLLCIARDMVEVIADNSEAANSNIMNERDVFRKVVAA